MAENEQAEGAGGEGAPVSVRGNKFKLIIIVVGVLGLIGAGAATYFFLSHHGKEQHAEAPAPKPPVFVDVPDMLVNLSAAPGDRVQYLRVKIALEVKEEKQAEEIKPSMPRVTDIFQTYVRELRSSDLNGSVGIFRLKEELTKRVNAAVAPIQVSAVLFKEVVLQ
jgi:flagellar FliL protein